LEACQEGAVQGRFARTLRAEETCAVNRRARLKYQIDHAMIGPRITAEDRAKLSSTVVSPEEAAAGVGVHDDLLLEDPIDNSEDARIAASLGLEGY
jgi:hypothetical protein